MMADQQQVLRLTLSGAQSSMCSIDAAQDGLDIT
jgi:hypothetical protein